MEVFVHDIISYYQGLCMLLIKSAQGNEYITENAIATEISQVGYSSFSTWETRQCQIGTEGAFICGLNELPGKTLNDIVLNDDDFYILQVGGIPEQLFDNNNRFSADCLLQNIINDIPSSEERSHMINSVVSHFNSPIAVCHETGEIRLYDNKHLFIDERIKPLSISIGNENFIRPKENLFYSSEVMLGIEAQPSDSCDHNHPIYNALNESLSDMNDLINDHDSWRNVHLFTPNIRDDQQKLVDIVYQMEAWRDGWHSLFKESLSPLVSRDILSDYAGDIETMLMQTTPLDSNTIDDAIDRALVLIDSFDRECRSAYEHIEESLNSIESLTETVEDLERKLSYDQDQDVSDDLSSELDEASQSLADEESSYEDKKQEAQQDLTAICSELENYIGLLGPAMQSHNETLRSNVSCAKNAIKLFIDEELTLAQQRQYAYSTQLNLETKLSGFENKASTLLCGSFDLIIRKLDLDKELPLLSQIKQHYPSAEKLIGYENLDEATQNGMIKSYTLERVEQSNTY